MSLPAFLLRHHVTITPYRGDSAYGPAYGDAVVGVRALVAESVRQVRDKDGREVTSTAQIIAAPELDCPPGSRVVLPSGRTTTTISTARHTAPGLPVPACTEVMCE
ncbi:hypothetical protein AB8O64_19755 [Streptomyces sp. QH1-20]|uniref:hypothetical protein n=1 Tax=Streptomyces sp. QH1-20 TaxID=3240934 RepID=UPI003511B625